uniref:Uncharacterized protein n=1 Tax=Panagrellus redivivus TaxID=6233 RepID=A0A7E4ZUM3_PANRE
MNPLAVISQQPHMARPLRGSEGTTMMTRAPLATAKKCASRAAIRPLTLDPPRIVIEMGDRES